MTGAPVVVEARDDAAKMRAGAARRVRVARIDDHLDRHGLTRPQPLLEAGADVDHEQRSPAIDDRGDIGLVAQGRNALEHPRGVHVRDQLGGGRAVALVEDCIGRVPQVEGCGVAEDQRLHDRGQHEHDPVRGILQGHQQLFATDIEQVMQDCDETGHSSRFRVFTRARASSTAA